MMRRYLLLDRFLLIYFGWFRSIFFKLFFIFIRLNLLFMISHLQSINNLFIFLQFGFSRWFNIFFICVSRRLNLLNLAKCFALFGLNDVNIFFESFYRNFSCFFWSFQQTINFTQNITFLLMALIYFLMSFDWIDMKFLLLKSSIKEVVDIGDWRKITNCTTIFKDRLRVINIFVKIGAKNKLFVTINWTCWWVLSFIMIHNSRWLSFSRIVI